MYKSTTILFSFFRLNNSTLNTVSTIQHERDGFLKYETDRYFEFIHDDILQLNEALVHSRDNVNPNEISIESEGAIRIIKFITSFIVFPKQSNGVIFFQYDWISNDNPLDQLSKLTSLRYLGTHEKFLSATNLITLQGGSKKNVSWLDLAKTELGNFVGEFQFYSNKLGKVHLIQDNILNHSSNLELDSYNALRITNKAEGYNSLHKDQYAYSDPRIYSFAMNEGLILCERGKSNRQILSKYAPILYQCVFIKLGFTDVSFKLLSSESNLRIDPRAGLYDKGKIQGLRELRKLFLLLKFTSKVPISNYQEMEALRAYLMKKFSSEIDFENFSDSLEDVFEFLQNESDRESSERESKISWILGILGVTGFISFIFDYVFVNGDIRLIDYLSGPATWFPLLSFVAIIAMFYKINK